MESKHSRNSVSIQLRIIALAAALFIVLGSLPAIVMTAHAETTTPVYDKKTGFQYILDYSSGAFNAVIYGYVPENLGTIDEKTELKVDIPKEISEAKYPVTGIDSQAFDRCSYKNRITTVSIPGSVKFVGDYAFKECSSLKSVTFASGDLKKIGSYAFSGCSKLEDITVPEKVTEIGYAAFSGCSAAKNIKLPSSLETIGQFAFSGCRTVEKLEIPKDVKNIGAAAFEACTKLETVTLPEKITTIDNDLFRSCTSLRTVKTTAKDTNAGAVKLPETVTSIGSGAFSECPITSITVPEKVTSIGSMAFGNCRSLTAATMPYNLSDIANDAFFNSPVEFWGYTGSPAYYYAYQHNIIFHESGQVHKVTFSADNMYVTVSNIAISSSSGLLVIPPAMVTKGEILTITATAPIDYEINYMTINEEPFPNGSTYIVGDNDISIFVSYIAKAASTTTFTSTTEAFIPPVNTDSTSVTTAQTTTEATTSTFATTTTQATTTTTQQTTTTTQQTTTTTTTQATTSRPVETEGVSNEDTTGGTDDSYIKVDSDLQDVNGVKVRIVTQRDNFIGSAIVRITNTEEAYEAARAVSGQLDTEDPIYYAFDISLLDRNGTENPGIMAKGSITFQLPVPNALLPYANSIQVYHIVNGEPVFIKSSLIEDINGVRRIQFETDSFSPYMLIASTGEDEEVTVIDEEDAAAGGGDDTTRPADDETAMGIIIDDTTNGGNSGGYDGTGGAEGNDAQIVDDTPKKSPTYTNPTYNGNINPHTGAVIAGVTICGATLLCIPLARSRKKRRRTKSTME